MTSVLEDLATFLPQKGVIHWCKDDTSVLHIMVPPLMFIHNINANDPKVKIERRVFWDENCDEFIIHYYKSDQLVVFTTLKRSMPKEAMWLDSRR